MLVKYARFGLYALRGRYRVQAAPNAKAYSDFAITPVIDAEGEELEMFALNDSARAAVAKARHQAERRRQAKHPALVAR
jgi:hypothetical protein